MSIETLSLSVTSVRQYRHNFTNMRQVLPVQGRIQDFKLEGRAHLKKMILDIKRDRKEVFGLFKKK